MPKLKTWLLGAAVLACLALAGGYAVWRTGTPAALAEPLRALLGTQPRQQPKGERGRATHVELAKARPGQVPKQFDTSATVIADELVTLTSEVAARIKRVYAEDGETVQKGDPIIRFDDSEERLAVEAAQAELADAEASLQRARTLYERDVAAETRVETAKAAAGSARARLERAREALDDRTVRAPFAGQLGFVEISPGAYLRPGGKIASLQAVDDLRLRFQLPLDMAPAAPEDMSVTLQDQTGECAKARILTVSPVIDPDSRTRAFEAALPGGCGLKPGGFVSVSVGIGTRDAALVVPHAAVIREGFDAFVYRAEKQEDALVARRVPVKLGTFAGKVNDGAEISGRVEPRNGGSAYRINSEDAGGVLGSAGLLRKARDGTMDLVLVPGAEPGSYEGQLQAQNLRLEDAPALAALLNALSVVGILEQLDGDGIHFGQVDARFRLTPERVILQSGSAVGASMGISMDGYYFIESGRMDMQGVISPLYMVNAIGGLFTRRGEGLVGFNYTLRGTAADPRVEVNPLSLLTPGMFREVFRRPPPGVSRNDTRGPEAGERTPQAERQHDR